MPKWEQKHIKETDKRFPIPASYWREVRDEWNIYDPAACNVSGLDSTHADQKILHDNSTRSIPYPCEVITLSHIDMKTWENEEKW